MPVIMLNQKAFDFLPDLSTSVIVALVVCHPLDDLTDWHASKKYVVDYVFSEFFKSNFHGFLDTLVLVTGVMAMWMTDRLLSHCDTPWKYLFRNHKEGVYQVSFSLAITGTISSTSVACPVGRAGMRGSCIPPGRCHHTRISIVLLDVYMASVSFEASLRVKITCLYTGNADARSVRSAQANLCDFYPS